jgi:protein arginine phosphatase
MNIYFICTGNTCRSPMAAAILGNKNLEGVEVRSAGIYAIEGSPMSQNAKDVLNQENIKHNHKSSIINEQDVIWADLILTMTSAHKEQVLRMAKEAQGKTYTLLEYAMPHNGVDIHDPFGGDLFVYEQTFEQLNEAINSLEKKLTLEEKL